MPSIHSLNVNFNGGELTPLMNGRVDFDGYRSGCVTMENFMVRPYGGAFKSPGTEYIGEVKDSTKTVRLIGLKISRDENYILEVGAGYFRFWKEDDPAYLQINSGYSVVAHSTSTTYQLGDLCSSSGTNYVRVDNGNATDSSFASALSAGYWHALTGLILEWPNDYSEADLATIQWQQINRLLVIVHESHEPILIESVPTDSLTSDFIQHAAWSDNAATDAVHSFLVAGITYTFPPLIEHPLSNDGGTVTLSLAHTAWATSTDYVTGNIRVVSNVAYYCKSNHTSAAGTQPGVGASWATVWRLATGEEVDYNLTASSADIFSGMSVADGFVIEPSMYKTSSTSQRSIEMDLQLPGGTITNSRAIFIQGGYQFSTTWLSQYAMIGSLTLQESFDGVNFEIKKEWYVASNVSGTILFEDTTPTQGAWYRLGGYCIYPGANGSRMQLEPLSAQVKLPFVVTELTSSTVLKVRSRMTKAALAPVEAIGVAALIFYNYAFSDDNGYPAAVGLHNLRLWFGGTAKEPNRIRGSNVDDFFNFSTGDNDDDGFDFVLNSNESNLVRWISGFKQGLVVGTEGEEWTVQGGGDGSEVLKPTNIQAIRRNRSGSKALSAIQTRDALLWVSLTGRKVFEFAYVFASDDYQSPDMTLRAEHVTDGGIVDIAFQNEPDPVLWCVTANGVLLGFSYNRQNQISAWFRRTTDGLFESVATLRSAGDADRVWFVVKRTINGATKRYIERFYPTAQAFDFSTASDFCYLDCAKKITQASSTAVSGLSHLEGEDVKVWHSGTTIESKTVASGAITLSAAATTMFVGLSYEATLQPEPIELVLQDGTAQGRRMNAQRIHLLLQSSMGGTVSNDPDVAGFSLGYPTGTTGAFTGRFDEHIPAEWLDALTLTFKHSDPTPFNLLGFVLKAEISGQ